jgi:GWxTD domain-containing protein
LKFRERFRVIFTFLLLFAFFPVTNLVSQEGVDFDFDYSISIENPEKPDVTITIYIPYNQLNFIISDSIYKANVDISMLFYKDGKEKGGEIWRRKIVLSNYEQTIAGDKGERFNFTIGVAPGKYKMYVKVEDIGSENSSLVEKEINIEGLKEKYIWLSKPSFFIEKEDGKKKWLVSEKLEADYDSIFSMIKVASDSSHRGEYLLVMRIEDEEGKVVLKSEKQIVIDSLMKSERYILPIADFEEGDFTVFVELLKDGKIMDKNSKEITIAYPFFFSKLYEERVEQMDYILDGEEKRKLKESKKEDREKVWNEFWREKDPIPETSENETSEEYFRRVDYANEHFSTFQSGWRTDRGRIYIIYGPPDEIEYHPFDLNAPPYQVWYYYSLGISFIFVDSSMTGDYNLIDRR